MSSSPKFELAFLHPRYWVLWLSLSLLWLVILLPYPVLLMLGWVLGKLLYWVGGKRRKIARRNIELCFPELSEAERVRLLKQNFSNYGMALLETGMSWWWPAWRFNRLVKIEGLEYLDQLQGQGALLIAIHFTHLEIGAAALNLHRSIDGMHRPHKNRLYDYIQSKGRGNRNDETITYPRKDVRQVLQALKRGRIIWYAPDQDYGIKQGIFAPFMGVNAATVTATARFASSGKAKIIPLSQQRLSGGRGYKVTIHPPLEGFPQGDEYEDAVAINLLVEALIRQQPEAYMWVHRRFKTRPPGEPSLYK